MVPVADPNNPLPPASLADEWDDPELLAEEAALGRTVLPPRREVPVAEIQPVRSRPRAEMGLQISVKLRGGRSGANSGDRDAATPDPEVVKLDCPSPELPFQPNHIIVPRRDEAPSPDPEPALPKEESPDWGAKQSHPLRWIIGSGLGVLALLVAALAVQELLLTEPPEDPPAEALMADDDPLPEVAGFEIDGSSELQARDLLAKYAKVRDFSEALPLVRDGEALAPRIKAEWQAWGTPPDWQVPPDAAWETGDEAGRGFGLLTGHTPDFNRFRAYFVREGGTLKLDWEATHGAGDSSFDALGRGIGTGGRIRALVKRDAYFTETFPESLYRSFKLTSPDQSQVVWAYAKLGSRTDTDLMTYFPSGVVIQDEKSEHPMTLRLAPPPPGAQKNQWLIMEMLHNEWVSP